MSDVTKEYKCWDRNNQYGDCQKCGKTHKGNLRECKRCDQHFSVRTSVLVNHSNFCNGYLKYNKDGSLIKGII